MNKHDLEERVINFAVLIVEIVGTMPNIKEANHVAGQLLRSGTSPALAIRHCQMKIALVPTILVGMQQ